MDNSIAQMSSVSKIYQRSGVETRALHNVTFEAHPGELVLILGPSGSGKTTFLTLLAGLQRPTTGDVLMFGKNVNKYSDKELQMLRARRIGFIFQTFYLLDSLTSFENIMLIMKFSGLDKTTASKRAEELLDRFGVKHLKNALPKTLSQGEKQRIAVARALANGAELILADEPTGSLATQQGMIIISFLKEIIKSENKCVIISSHDERIKSSADRVIQLSDGEII
jgi:putative ABC transport system ATP-binding protein